MTQSEFLLDMLDYYSVDPATRRCASGVGCKYHPHTIGKTKEQSEGCAIGRKLPEEYALELDETHVGGMSFFFLDHVVESMEKTYPDHQYKYRRLKDKFPQELRNLELFFLSDVQGFHDNEEYWSKIGLSEEGVERLLEIIQKHKFDLSVFEKYLN